MGTAADSPAWYQRFTAVESDDESELYRVLVDERRRTLLSVLGRCDAPVSESRLARLVATHETSGSPNAVTSADREGVQLSLHHVHLPLLEAAGLVERTDDDHIDCTQHPFWTNSDIRTLLAQSDVTPSTKTATFDLLANHRRRAILTLLKDQRELTVGELAAELGKTPLADHDLPKLIAELVHCHLPKLEDAHVVKVDSSESRIRYTGNVVLEEWFSDVRTQQEEREGVLMMMCVACGEFVFARDEESLVPLQNECPDCGGQKFKDIHTDEVIQVKDQSNHRE